MKLLQILKEIVGSPKALILAGSPGAGKGYVLGQLNIDGIKILNLDNFYINYLKNDNISLDLKTHNAEDRSKAAKLMALSSKDLQKSIKDTIGSKESFILDGTSASSKKTLELKAELEQNGYEVFMLYVYTDLERSLKQNQDRFERSNKQDRSLNPSIIIRTWINVTENFDIYYKEFGENFVAVSNTLEEKTIQDYKSAVEKYVKPFKPTDVPKKELTDKEKERKEKQYIEFENKVNHWLQQSSIKTILDNSVSKDEAALKIKDFLNGK